MYFLNKSDKIINKNKKDIRIQMDTSLYFI